MTETLVTQKGLAGVIADDTAVSKVDVDELQLYYRGYNINDLCDNATFLETVYLLLYGELPTARELAEFAQKEAENREVSEAVYEMAAKLPKHSHPMDVLRIGMSLSGLSDIDNPLGENDSEKVREKAVATFAKIPTILATSYRAMNGQTVVKQDPTLPYTQNFLSMMQGEKVQDPLKKIGRAHV